MRGDYFNRSIQTLKKMEGLIKYILEKIVDDPGSISIQKKEENGGDVYMISLNRDDIGKVIGRGGSTINSLNRLLYVKRSKMDNPSPGRFFLKINEL